MRKKLTMVLLAVMIILTSLNAYSSAVETIGEGYKTYSIKGRSVLFEDDLVKRKELRKKVAEWITIDLRDVELLLPKKAYKSISKVAIWIDYTTGPEEVGGMSGKGACYYPGPSFLFRNGLSLNKIGGVEIFDAYTYAAWRHMYSGKVVLHELAHAYEHQVISKKERNELIATYQRAKLSGKYNRVEYKASGQYYRAYAMSNYHEYFTELTEAYYGDNDYFPHNCDQLKHFDPEGYALIDKLWNR
jgi:hypothetical protein